MASLVVSGRHLQIHIRGHPLRIDELRLEDFEDEKDKTVETRRLTRQHSAELVLKVIFGSGLSQAMR